MNSFPFLFQAVTLTNPFLDVTRAMSNKDLHLTEHEWDEFGNPVKDEKAKNLIASYCPFDNLNNNEYPSALLVGTLDDENVPFWHPVCFVMKMRDKVKEYFKNESKKHGDILLHVEEEGGHHLHGNQHRVGELTSCFLLGQYAKWRRKKTKKTSFSQ